MTSLARKFSVVASFVIRMPCFPPRVSFLMTSLARRFGVVLVSCLMTSSARRFGVVASFVVNEYVERGVTEVPPRLHVAVDDSELYVHNTKLVHMGYSYGMGYV